ncbi:MAG: rod shape-determining protein MreD [Oscillospiraceae bacterium]|jgi:rod shape-determining protein MreD|nr:rod shape-determining protein MreD [Oscillospiraceae bacterium]
MLHTRMALFRWVCFSVLLLMSVILQTMVFPRLSGVPNPMVSVAASVSAAVFSGVPGGAAAGFACGLLCDALTPGVEAYFTLTTMAAGALTGFLCGKYLQRTFWSALLLSAASLCVIGAGYALFFQVAAGRAPWGAIVAVGLPEILGGVLCVPLVYPAFRGVAGIFVGE